jgi:ComF family protein
MRALVGTLLDVLLPERCALCDRDCRRGICELCRRDLPRIIRPCERCGLPEASHPACRPIEGIESVVAPLLFAGSIVTAVHALKYRGRRSAGRALGLLLVDELGDRLPVADMLVPVPLHPVRLRQRTFNQAGELARTIADHTARPLLTNPVRRLRDTAPQAMLPAAARGRNLQHAFEVRARLDSTRIMIVDDVVTTGATVAALAAALAEAGADSISVVALARAVPDSAVSARSAGPGAQSASAGIALNM